MNLIAPSFHSRRLLYSSLVGLVLLIFRNVYWRENMFQVTLFTSSEVGIGTHNFFLIWNLFLAWMPYFLSRKAETLSSSSKLPWSYWPVVFLWLLFWPNAPYLVTDLIHLRARYSVPLWYDALLFFSFAWTGIWFAIMSLQIMERQWQRRYGPKAAKFAALFVLFIGSFGVFLGRHLRWNSWEVFTRPLDLLNDLTVLLTSGGMMKAALGMSVSFFLFLWMVYQTHPVTGSRVAETSGEAGR